MTNPNPPNPLLESWTTPFGVAPFDRIEPGQFREALDRAMAAERDEVRAISQSADAPTFENTIVALERSGRLLAQVSGVFFNLTGAHTNDALKAIEREVSPVLSRHHSAIYLDDALFRRIETLAGAANGLGLDEEQARLLERYHRTFMRRGAGRSEAVRQRLAEIGERLAVLGTRFGQNLLADEQSYSLVLAAEEDLAGLPDFVRAPAREAAIERGLDGHIITLSRSSIEPFLQFSTRRDLRQQAFEAWIRRGENGGDTDNRAIVAETVALRAERAGLLGFPTFAHYRLDDAMAKTPEAVQELLRSVWEPARRLALREAGDLQAMIDGEEGGFRLGAADWRFYAERLRKQRFDFDAAAVKPYLTLEAMIAAAFDCASRLFGVSFKERTRIPLYHPDVRAFEVTDAEGRPVGLFLGDYFARSSKRSGAWMSGFRTQRRLDEDVRPIIVNVMNFAKGADGQPTLLSIDDARTLFHEFGHALHGLLSDVTYPSLAGTSVTRDFVEFPSQLFEHWMEEPAVLSRFARHYETGEPLPAAMIERILAARKFDQGHTTVEYVSSALVDLEFHLLPSADNLDPMAFERETLAAIRMPDMITMRHRTPQFGHVFSGDGYSSAYYSYMWSEVLDADGFAAFEEAGDIFDPDTAARLKAYVYAAGDLRDPAEAYTLFRGRMPQPAALLRQRGLIETGAEAEL